MTKQLITFEIADKRLGVDIMAIREIRAWTPPTPIPHAPAFVRGIVNLRGTVLPGNSGGPLLRPDGFVLGMVFGADDEAEATGYALTADELRPAMESAFTSPRAVDTGSCRIRD